MIDHILLPKLSGAETTELARMLLARKLMPEDRRGTLSPMVNAPLAQCVLLQDRIRLTLAGWLPRLKEQFLHEIADTGADPSLSRYLDRLNDDAARTNLIGQYFLPFQTRSKIDIFSAQNIADAFTADVGLTPDRLDMGPLYPAGPENGSIILPRPFIDSIFDQILIGRHSHLHLETRRRGETDKAASDAAIHAFLENLAKTDTSAGAPRPFHARELRYEDFAQSHAYTQMMELGFSRDEMMAAIAPWDLVD